ncbi:MarR family transcriptional regulator [Nocardioides flavescens]
MTETHPAPVLDPLETPWSPDQVAVMHALRDWVQAHDELVRRQAAWMDLPVTDVAALGQVVWAAEAGSPLSPTELARLHGFTSGATTALVNRLEAAGHVERTRESSDRRRVTLRPTPAARERTREFLSAVGTDIATLLASTPPDELRTVTSFLQRLTAASHAGGA